MMEPERIAIKDFSSKLPDTTIIRLLEVAMEEYAINEVN